MIRLNRKVKTCISLSVNYQQKMIKTLESKSSGERSKKGNFSKLALKVRKAAALKELKSHKMAGDGQ